MAAEPRLTLVVDGTKLKRLRLGKAWTQEELSKRAGLNLTTVSLLESKKKTVSPRTLQKLAKALEADPFDFAEVVEEVAV